MNVFAWIHGYNPHIQLKYCKLNSRELIVVIRKSIVWREKLTVTSRELANSLKQPFCLLSIQLKVKLSPSLELDSPKVALLGGLPILLMLLWMFVDSVRENSAFCRVINLREAY